MTFFIRIIYFSSKLNIKGASSFAEYIKFLKLSRNVSKKNDDFSKWLYFALFAFVENPKLFKNRTELFEVDELHQNLYKFNQNKSDKESYNALLQQYYQMSAKDLLDIAYKNFNFIFEANRNNDRFLLTFDV